jgi:putative transcriptional regulator
MDTMSTPNRHDSDLNQNYLQGYFLVASPTLREPRFEKAVIYLVSHNERGAKGFVVNKVNPLLSAEALFEQLDITCAPNILYPSVFDGGPVEGGRGYVLHGADFKGGDTQYNAKTNIGVTSTVDVLEAIAQGKGPANAHILLGAATWAPHQLETELVQHSWLLCQTDASLVFNTAAADCWTAAMALMGVHAGVFSDAAGSA